MIYNLQYDGIDIAKVEITDSFTSQAAIKEMVEFWSGWEDRLAEFNGNYTQCWLNKLGTYILYNGREPWGGTEEGWYPLDGSKHIWLRKVWPYEFDDHLIEVEEEME